MVNIGIHISSFVESDSCHVADSDAMQEDNSVVGLHEMAGASIATGQVDCLKVVLRWSLGECLFIKNICAYFFIFFV